MKTNFEQFLENLDLESFSLGLPSTQDLNKIKNEYYLDVYRIGIEEDLSATYAFGENLNTIYRFFYDEMIDIFTFEQIEVSSV